MACCGIWRVVFVRVPCLEQMLCVVDCVPSEKAEAMHQIPMLFVKLHIM